MSLREPVTDTNPLRATPLRDSENYYHTPAATQRASRAQRAQTQKSPASPKRDGAEG